MTDRNRLDEIRANVAHTNALMAEVDDDDWEYAPREELPLLDPRLVNPDLEWLLSELAARDEKIAERTRERDDARRRCDNALIDRDAARTNAATQRERAEAAEITLSVAQSDAASFMHSMHAAEKCVTSDQRYEAGFDAGFSCGREGRASAIAELTLRAEAAERRVAWHPIETAPIATWVLLRHVAASGTSVDVGISHGSGHPWWDSTGEDQIRIPTHWMSLPSTDVTEPAGGDDV